MQDPHILPPDALVNLTGAKRASDQAGVLSKHGIKFVIRTDGKIRTTWEAVNAALAGKQQKPETEPNLDFLK